MALDLDSIDPTADPSLGLAASTVPLAARPGTLAGKVVALLDNRKEQGELIVKTLGGKVTVLHEGSVLAEGSMDAVQNDPKVVEVYLGEPQGAR